jgi:hypothetical protein
MAGGHGLGNQPQRSRNVETLDVLERRRNRVSQIEDEEVTATKKAQTLVKGGDVADLDPGAEMWL